MQMMANVLECIWLLSPLLSTHLYHYVLVYLIYNIWVRTQHGLLVHIVHVSYCFVLSGTLHSFKELNSILNVDNLNAALVV